MPHACKARTLPIELIPHTYSSCWSFDSNHNRAKASHSKQTNLHTQNRAWKYPKIECIYCYNIPTTSADWSFDCNLRESMATLIWFYLVTEPLILCPLQEFMSPLVHSCRLMYRGCSRVADRLRPETEPGKVTAELSEGIAQLRLPTLIIGQKFLELKWAFGFWVTKKIGPTGTWTRIAGFRVQSDNHYTIGPNTTGITPGGTRTHNLTLRRGAPYPLGHRGIGLKCSRRGSNPRPSAHKTNALPLSYGSCCDHKLALHINT